MTASRSQFVNCWGRLLFSVLCVCGTDMPDEVILARLFKLNQERAAS